MIRRIIRARPEFPTIPGRRRALNQKLLQKRISQFQGRPRKCSELDARLFDWFLDIRSIVRGRVDTQFVLSKVHRLLRDLGLARARRREAFDPPLAQQDLGDEVAEEVPSVL